MLGDQKLTVPSSSPSISPTRMQANLAELRKQRGNIKGRLTQFKKYLDSFDGSDPSQLQLKEIKFRMQAATDLFKTFNQTESQIELISPESEVSSNAAYVESFESLYFSTLATAESIIEQGETGDSSSVKPNNRLSRVKLPDIKLPVFEGSFDHWLEFKNSYVTMIHTRSDLDEIQKFHYLRSSLSGSALQVISALEFTASNYKHAWDLLENRFHNCRLLVHNHLKSLFSIPPLKQESHSQIRKLIDTVLRNLRALKTLDEPTESWDTIIIYLITSKLDLATERDWENHKGSILSDSRRLKLDDLLSFLRNKADTLDMINASHSQNKSISKPTHVTNKQSHHTHNPQVHSFVTTTPSSSSKSKSSNDNLSNKRAVKCPSCGQNHSLYTCYNFLNSSVKDRIKLVNEKQLCRNCLRAGHSFTDCLFGTCKQCHGKHNTLLHGGLYDSDASDACVRSERTSNVNPSAALHSIIAPQSCHSLTSSDGVLSPLQALQPVLLCTALVEIEDRDKRIHTARALLDNGSQHCFISDNLRKRLNAPSIQSTIRIVGVAQSVTQSNQLCKITIRSKLNDFSKAVKCFVLQRITTSLPSTSIDTDCIRIPSNIKLADPSFHISSEVDILIGAELFCEILEEGKIRLVNGPYLQNSKLGWLLSGPIYDKRFKNNLNQVHCNFTQSLENQLKLFWEVENVVFQSSNVLSRDEQLCEELFMKTTKREGDGRFSVRIPLKDSPDKLGDSYNLAKNRFLSLERKLQRSSDYKRLYCDFMSEYEALGHMTRINNFDTPNFFLPHHGVMKDSTTTKLRVVFDASALTTTNKSLNDIQYPGSALQNDIFSILLRFRQFKYVACADVEKMFRQVLIQPDQRSLQLIVWRDEPTKPLSVYQLNTVTYGTASAPYLSMRCIRQLALDCTDDVTSRIITEDIFVDDLITGDDDHQQLLQNCSKVTEVLQSGCFSLRKWTFNSDVTHNNTPHQFVDQHTQNKTLGIGWCNDTDELYYTTKVEDYSHIRILTKRVMLSIISQIYDPLGLLSPTVIIAKILLQKLYTLSDIDWDTPVPHNITLSWNNFVESLKCLPNLKIPRHVMSDYVQHKELHIFTDASEKAYGACAYIRTHNNNSNITVKLLCAKSKIAPLKSLSTARLEILGAQVGANLYKRIINSLRLEFTKVYFWADSTIVIGWLGMSPHLLKVFVRNRVTEINELTGDAAWLHVSSQDNPADLLSRGLPLNSLIHSKLWWNGPSYLHDADNYNFSNIPTQSDSINLQDLPELKPHTTNLVSVCPYEIIQFDKFSSYNRLKCIWAYVLRFITNARDRAARDLSVGSKQQTGSLTVGELNASQRLLVRCAQRQSFPDVYHCLMNNLPIKTNAKEMNRISGLNVFLDDDGLIRVGRRLCNASKFDYNKKHPVLLCSKHPLSVLLVRHEHLRLFHAGPQLLLSSLRETWWVLGARNLVRKTVRGCITCTRIRGKTLTPIMGNLPSERLDPGFPFMRTGVDYAGPIMILSRKGRGARLVKGYVCLFICFLTKAVHLELVTSLSTEDFILALKRFISRRGKPNAIFSDNGKNFVGAAKELSSFLQNNSKQIVDFTANDGILFKVIPPYSPHMGGLWESGIRSCKYHLKHIVGNANLTYEELSTVLTQVEAILNSRPLSPLSTDPSDFTPLTPGHFLIGRPLAAPPSEDLVGRCENFTTHTLPARRAVAAAFLATVVDGIRGRTSNPNEVEDQG